MLTVKLIDTIWATRKAESLNGLKFMLAEVIGGGPDAGKRLVVYLGERNDVARDGSIQRKDSTTHTKRP